MVMEHQHHEGLITGIAKQFKTVLDDSPQGVYIYLDDEHKVCNQKFAAMLGYGSAKQWNEIDAPLADIVEEDQTAVVKAYTDASENLVASETEVRFKNVRTGRTTKARMIMAPVAFQGHTFVLHFLSKA
jgi:PAS domain-containing protein